MRERKLHLDKMLLGEILSVPDECIRFATRNICSKGFSIECGKLSNLNRVGKPKKFLK